MRRIDAEQGRLDVLVNDIWGGEKLIEWNTPLWEHDLAGGLRMLRLAIDTHLITSHFALPLLIRRPGGLVVEMTDGTREYNAANYRLSAFYDLAKTAVIRLAFAQSRELAPHGCTRGRADAGLDALGDDARASTGSPRTPGATRRSAARTSSRSPRARASSGARSPRSPPTRELERRNGGSFSSGGLAREYGFTDLDGSQPDCWRYMVEVQDAGPAAGRDRLPLTRLCRARGRGVLGDELRRRARAAPRRTGARRRRAAPAARRG